MFVLSMVVCATAMLSEEAKPQVKIASVSMFKNGYALVLRELSVDSRGEAIFENPPQAALGTFWVVPSEGMKIERVLATRIEKKRQVPVASLDEILSVNVGKEILIEIADRDPQKSKTLKGKLVAATGSVVVMETSEGRVAFQKQAVLNVHSPGAGLIYQKTESSQHNVLKVQTKGGSQGKIYSLSLERGIAWAPSYAVELLDDKKLTVTGKATIINDLGNLDEIEARLITGFPNIMFAGRRDPLTSGESLDAFIQSILGYSAQADKDSMLTQNVAQRNIRGEMRATGGFAQDIPTGGFDEGFETHQGEGSQVEELFFYKQPKVKLAKGERGYFILFKTEAAYESIYTWDLGDVVTQDFHYSGYPDRPGEIWKTLKFKNSVGQPLSTGPGTTFRSGEIIGQDVLNYTSAGAECFLRVTRALDVRAEMSEEEVSRVKDAIRDNYRPTYDLVTLKGTLSIQNFKKETVKMRITKDLTGEVIDASHTPKITKTAKGLRGINPRARLEWEPKVEPGQKLLINYSYKVYVRQN